MWITLRLLSMSSTSIRAAAYSGRVEQHKDHAVQAVGCGIDQPHDLLVTEHDRQLLWHLRENEIVVGDLIIIFDPQCESVNSTHILSHR
jgi:hypothetical protein